MITLIGFKFLNGKLDKNIMYNYNHGVTPKK